MLELHEVITLIYPNKSLKERGKIEARCKDFGIDYDVKTWLDVVQNDLITTQVKDNLVLTFFYNQDSYNGVIGEILTKLEIQSGGTIYFSDFDEETNEFYERYYAMTGFTFFVYLPSVTQIYLLGSRFLLLACVWGLPVISRLKQYFSRFCVLTILERDAKWFAEAIKKNSTPIQSNLTLGDWIGKFTSGSEILVENKVIQQGCQKIAELFEMCISGKIWSELEYSTCGHIKTGHQEKISIEELYLHRLEQTGDLSAWIADYQNVANWCKDRSLDFVKKVLRVVREKLPLSRYENQILNFTIELENNGFTGLGGVIMFNESTGEFEWNNELLN